MSDMHWRSAGVQLWRHNAQEPRTFLWSLSTSPDMISHGNAIPGTNTLRLIPSDVFRTEYQIGLDVKEQGRHKNGKLAKMLTFSRSEKSICHER